MTLSKAVQYLTTAYVLFLFVLCVHIYTRSPVDSRAWYFGREWESMQDRFLAARVEASKKDWVVYEKTPFSYIETEQYPSIAPDYDVTGWIRVQPYIVNYNLDGDYKAILNVMTMANERLWPETKDGKMKYRAPCGGRVDCLNPLAANVQCFVEQTDCNFGKPGSPYQDPKVLKTFLLECRGDVVCRRDKKPEDCCLITKTVKGKVLDL